jgi:hypothetical protein
MKAKLIKVKDYYYLQELSAEHIVGSQCERTLGDTDGNGEYGKLSKQNCDAIFGVTDVEKLAKEDADLRFSNQGDEESWLARNSGVVWGFNKAMELNKDKVFTLEDMKKCWEYASIDKHQIFGDQIGDSYMSFIQSLQQPSEIEVEIEMEENIILKVRSMQFSTQRAINAVKKEWFPKPKLDSNGCLILKRVTGAAN